ncbi:MAG: glycoside hydrolase, family 43 [Acidimicrobiales bacterium]|nr:glycoside hydrolase, family 43 [Acidimicrobiales bacterium]
MRTLSDADLDLRDEVTGPEGDPDVVPGRPRRGLRRLLPRSIRVRVALAALVVLAVLTGLVSQGLLIRGLQRDLFTSQTSDLQARTELLATRTRLQRDVGVLVGRLDGMTTAYRNQTAVKNSLQGQLAKTIENLKGVTKILGLTNGTLATTKQDLDAQVTQLRLTKECLNGVQLAMEKLSVLDYAGAVRQVEGVRPQCNAALNRSAQATGFAAYDGSAADPFIVRVGATYYGYATNSIGGSVQLLQGPSPQRMTLKGPALANLAAWARPGSTWGPSVLQRGDRWILYYTARIVGQDKSCISRAVAAGPAGPFLDDSILPIVCQLDIGGSIDPSPVVAADGSAWLVWKSEGARGVAPASIWSQRLTPDGLGVEGGPAGLINAQQRWERGVIEGPSMVERGGRWLLLYSGNDWNSAGYAIGAAACAGPQGPCRKLQDGPIYTAEPPLLGAGGQELFTGPDGQPWLAFHAWVDGQVGYPNPRRLYVAKIDLDARIPRIVQQRLI